MALSVPLMNARHIGHLLKAGEQLTHAAMWPHGRNTIATGSSRHILQVCWSFKFLFSSSRLLIDNSSEGSNLAVFSCVVLFWFVLCCFSKDDILLLSGVKGCCSCFTIASSVSNNKLTFMSSIPESFRLVYAVLTASVS